jgi:hypothetical protein
MGSYYADTGPVYGPLKYRDVVGALAVYEGPDCRAPVGTAHCIGWDAAGSAIWRLTVPDGDDEGPCVIADRQFISTRPDWRRLYSADLLDDLARQYARPRRRGRRIGRTSRAPSQA